MLHHDGRQLDEVCRTPCSGNVMVVRPSDHGFQVASPSAEISRAAHADELTVHSVSHFVEQRLQLLPC